MKCEDYRALLPEYWEGALEESERVTLEMHLESCNGCRAEAAQLGRVWHSLERIPPALPSANLRRRFYERLEGYQQGATEPGARSGARAAAEKPGWWKGWFPMRPVYQFALSAATLIIGFAAGYQIDNKRDLAQVSQLRTEVNTMRQLVTLSLLQQQNASERLKGVNWAYRVEQSDTEVLAALLHTVNHDSNVNVRLAAIDALHTFADSPVARKGLVQAIAKQDSPLVQVALIDTLADLRDRQAVPVLEKVRQDASANPEVRERAQWALGKLQ